MQLQESYFNLFKCDGNDYCRNTVEQRRNCRVIICSCKRVISIYSNVMEIAIIIIHVNEDDIAVIICSGKRVISIYSNVMEMAIVVIELNEEETADS